MTNLVRWGRLRLPGVRAESVWKNEGAADHGRIMNAAVAC
jgi:hypothetical protein